MVSQYPIASRGSRGVLVMSDHLRKSEQQYLKESTLELVQADNAKEGQTTSPGRLSSQSSRSRRKSFEGHPWKPVTLVKCYGPSTDCNSITWFVIRSRTIKRPNSQPNHPKNHNQ